MALARPRSCSTPRPRPEGRPVVGQFKIEDLIRALREYGGPIDLDELAERFAPHEEDTPDEHTEQPRQGVGDHT